MSTDWAKNTKKPTLALTSWRPGMIGVTNHRLTQIYTDWVKNTEDTENPQKTQKLFLAPLASSWRPWR